MNIAIMSDIHANIFALRRIIADINTESIDLIFVAGDIVGYYYWPSETVDLLMSDTRVCCIAGNHEEILERYVNENDVRNFYREKYGAGYDLCMEQLSSNQFDWLRNLKKSLTIELDGVSFYMKHTSLGDEEIYLYPDANVESLIQNHSNCDVSIYGHTHYPFIHTHKGSILLNPGSVGQPRDMGGLASYVVFNTENKVVRFKRVPFDREAVHKATLAYDPNFIYNAKILFR